jgi:hypothetical protein
MRDAVFQESTMTNETKEKKGKSTHHWPPEETRRHLKTAHAEMRESIKALFPPEFVEHRRAAHREMLLAARTLIDHAIEHLED